MKARFILVLTVVLGTCIGFARGSLAQVTPGTQPANKPKPAATLPTTRQLSDAQVAVDGGAKALAASSAAAASHYHATPEFKALSGAVTAAESAKERLGPATPQQKLAAAKAISDARKSLANTEAAYVANDSAVRT